MRKIPASLESPIDNVLIDLAAWMAPSLKATGHTPNLLTTYSAAAAAMALWSLHRGQVGAFAALWMLNYFWDCADGFFARKYDQVTAFGDLYDHGTDIGFGLALAYLVYTRYDTPWWAGVVLAVAGLLTQVHFGCQQKMYGKEAGAEFLDVYRGLCPDASWSRFTRFFGPGTLNLLIVLVVAYLDTYHKKVGVA